MHVVKTKLALAALILGSAGTYAAESRARAKPPLRNQPCSNGSSAAGERCIKSGTAMVRSLKHMRSYQPAGKANVQPQPARNGTARMGRMEMHAQHALRAQ